MNTFIFWLGFIAVAAFIFGVMYFFVVQRNKAYRLLAAEKERSERLLRRIEADLEQAARIQQDLLPKASPRLDGFDVDGLNVPCYEVGGDYFDFIPIDEDRLGVVIADVSGKGISAALLMASLRAALLAEVKPDYDLGQMTARLNEFVYKSSGPSSFVTFFFVELDRRRRELRYVDAGHLPPLVLAREARASSLSLSRSDFPLGMFSGTAYQTGTMTLAEGDVAVLFTDGIPEGRNDGGEDYGEGRLERVVRENRDRTAAAIRGQVIGDTRGFVCSTQPCDDITLVVIKRLSAPA